MKWVQPMLNPRDCIHGSLARKCDICALDAEIHGLRKEIAQTAREHCHCPSEDGPCSVCRARGYLVTL